MEKEDMTSKIESKEKLICYTNIRQSGLQNKILKTKSLDFEEKISLVSKQEIKRNYIMSTIIITNNRVNLLRRYYNAKCMCI